MSTYVAKEYVPTIINSRPLLPRLATELKALEHECESAWPYFRQHPILTTSGLVRRTLKRSVRVVIAPNVLAALSTVSMVVLAVLVFEQTHRTFVGTDDSAETEATSEPTMINLKELDKKREDSSIGRNGNGRVGFQQNKSGEGSGEIRRKAQGGGGSGNHEPQPPQTGKMPPPSNVLAAIPKIPVRSPSLPVAGIDVDPALWRDLKAPAYGDPRSTSDVSSKGPGNGGGIGTNNGLGIGEGEDGGYGPGSKGNMGGKEKQTGCCGESGGNGNDVAPENPFRGSEVEQRARLLFKPEPQYTEEARRNQITGTVMLRVVFSSGGQVEQIRAVQTLPFGLTERAIAAARQIKFVPATKSGHSVSVYMQLEYNFNLY